jgi:hypothetical protein
MIDEFISAWKRDLINAILMLLLGAAVFGVGIYLGLKTDGRLRTSGIALIVGGATLFVFGLLAAVNT